MSTKKILIIDDQPEIIDVIKDLVEMDFEDVEVQTAEDPSLGLQKINNTSFCVICTDMNMPTYSGIEIIKLVRESGNINKDTPFIIITGDDSNFDESLDGVVNVEIINKAENIPQLLKSIGSYLV